MNTKVDCVRTHERKKGNRERERERERDLQRVNVCGKELFHTTKKKASQRGCIYYTVEMWRLK